MPFYVYIFLRFLKDFFVFVTNFEHFVAFSFGYFAVSGGQSSRFKGSPFCLRGYKMGLPRPAPAAPYPPPPSADPPADPPKMNIKISYSVSEAKKGDYPRLFVRQIPILRNVSRLE
ncbi:MAG: hypothetical protein MJY78_11230 [Fibrobacter sp.]|nr:hypothetical protein [Fibrobacter sp.]